MTNCVVANQVPAVDGVLAAKIGGEPRYRHGSPCPGQGGLGWPRVAGVDNLIKRI